jgi:hypothetical protein
MWTSQAIPESDDDGIIPHVPQQRTPSDASDAPAKQSDFSFTPFGASAGRLSPTLMPTGLPGDAKQSICLADEQNAVLCWLNVQYSSTLK